MLFLHRGLTYTGEKYRGFNLKHSDVGVIAPCPEVRL